MRLYISAHEELEKLIDQGKDKGEGYSVTMCEYDKKYAKAHNANKLFWFWLSLSAAFAPSIFLMFITRFELLSEYSGYSMINLVIVLSAVFILVFILVTIWLLPFFQSNGMIWYVIRDNGYISLERLMPFEGVRKYKLLYSPKIVKKRKDRWIIEYENSKGDRKKHTVSRAYPELDVFFESLEK